MHNVTLSDGTVIRELATHEERAEAVCIQEESWGAGFSERIPAAMLMVAQKTGGVAAGAFARDGRLLGFVFGVTGVRDGRPIHWSDLLAVRPEAQGRQLGRALKHYQRDRCRAAGVETMYWTFDPLVARNAQLNLTRLGATVSEFVPDMYGARTNSPRHALGTDRFVAAWPVRTDPTAMPSEPGLLGGIPVCAGLTGEAPPPDEPLPDAPAVAVRIPRDLDALLVADARRAREWHASTRRAFVHYFTRGYRVTAFVPGPLDHATYLLSHGG